jgi:hypothetical protein
MVTFCCCNYPYLLVDLLKFLAKQLKTKMTLTNILLKLKKGISVVLMVLNRFDNTRLVSKEKEMVKNAFPKIEKRTLNSCL